MNLTGYIGTTEEGMYKCILGNNMFIRNKIVTIIYLHMKIKAAPVAEWVRSLYYDFRALNHSIISPLCLV